MTCLRFFSFLTLIFIQVETIAQTTPKLLWPIKGATAGTNIIGKPGDTIAGHFNYADLFIGATDSNIVVAPIDGIIAAVGYQHSFPLNFQKLKGKPLPRFEKITDDNAYRKAWATIINEQNPRLKMDVAKYVSYSIGIKVGTNEMYYITGLRPSRDFKTGETIKRGDIIGTVGYCDTAFRVPHIWFSHSINTKGEDPMGEFGIPTTFKKFKPKVNYISEKHSVSSLVEAFNIMQMGLEQAHPGLYDYTPKARMDSLFRVTKQQIKSPMTSEEFRILITPIVTAIRDVHTSLYPNDYSNKPTITPEVKLGVVNGQLLVINPCKDKQIVAGTRVIAVNGQPANKVVKFIRSQYFRKDGYNDLPVDRQLMSNFWGLYMKAYAPSASSPLKLTFENGKIINPKYLPVTSTKKTDDAQNMSMQIINTKIGYLKINSFGLNQVEEDSAFHFIMSLENNKINNLIVDVRNNSGGEQDVLYRLTSYFIKEPYRKSCYSEVKSNTTYPTFRFTENYGADNILFGDFQNTNSKQTFTKTDTSVVSPSGNHYNGKLFILTDEFSVSAASEFAAVFAEQGVGKIIGRETGTCYYQMNAEQFAYFRLGNTGLNLMVPLIKIVSREKTNPRIPYGHGVIPDITVPLTLEEFTQSKDIILNSAVELINKREKESE